MLPTISKAFFLIPVALLFLTPHPATAQAGPQAPQLRVPCGYRTAEGGRLISAEYSAPCARYYAPYAMQAAAAYLPVGSFETARTQPTGSDVELTLGALGLPAAGDLSDHARKLLTGWRYEFGSEGYITCLHDKDAAYPEDESCERASAGWLRRRLAFGVGPAFNVWARRRTDRCVEVSIVFRGTAGLRDFISNGRRYTGWAADEAYQQLSRNVDAIVGRVAKMNCFRKRTQIVAVGHSLGAGLAEFSAFARKGRPRITKVFAFDPSSETGEGLIDPATLNANVKGNRKGRGLEIDIVYQPGEALEQLRASDLQFPLDRKCEPLVRTVRFDVVRERGLVAQHAIRGNGGFAFGMVETSYFDGQPTSAPPPVQECKTRYRRPSTSDDMIVQSGARATHARMDRSSAKGFSAGRKYSGKRFAVGQL
jgi:hypothetical protein